CSDGVKLGNHVTQMGRIAHKFDNPSAQWSETEEPSPVIGDYAVIGANALIIGPITIGENSYVAAGDVLRKSVPPGCMYYRSRLYKRGEWRGTVASNGFFSVNGRSGNPSVHRGKARGHRAKR